MKRITKNQSESFVTGIKNSLILLGARPIESKLNKFVTLELLTIVGNLEINIDTDNNNCYTVFTKFEDVEQAKKKFDSNPYNGKWNFHVTTDTPLEAIEIILSGIEQTQIFK